MKLFLLLTIENTAEELQCQYCGPCPVTDSHRPIYSEEFRGSILQGLHCSGWEFRCVNRRLALVKSGLKSNTRRMSIHERRFLTAISQRLPKHESGSRFEERPWSLPSSTFCQSQPRGTNKFRPGAADIFRQCVSL